MNIKLTKESDGYCAVLTDVKDAFFSGRGRYVDAAIGECLRANRERIGLTFEVHEPDQPVMYSTEYGRARSVGVAEYVCNMRAEPRAELLEILQEGVMPGGPKIFVTIEAGWERVGDNLIGRAYGHTTEPGLVGIYYAPITEGTANVD